MDTAKSRSLWLAILLGALLMVPTQSFAQVYIGGYGGVAIPHDADATIVDPALLGPIAISGEVEFDPEVIAGARVGYWLEALDLPYFGVELDFYWTDPELDRFKLAGLSIPIDGDLTIISGGLNGLVRYPYGPIQPYAGVGGAIVYGDLDLSGSRDDDVSVALQLMGGVRGFVTDNVALFAEYKWVLTEFEFDDKGSKLELDYSTSHIYGGIEWHFGTGGVHQKP
ncbi:MAG: porin family protein [Nitrospinae bacterium]|nr:porin family protein [Nitrospinota bacterium]